MLFTSLGFMIIIYTSMYGVQSLGSFFESVVVARLARLKSEPLASATTSATSAGKPDADASAAKLAKLEDESSLEMPTCSSGTAVSMEDHLALKAEVKRMKDILNK